MTADICILAFLGLIFLAAIAPKGILTGNKLTKTTMENTMTNSSERIMVRINAEIKEEQDKARNAYRDAVAIAAMQALMPHFWRGEFAQT